MPIQIEDDDGIIAVNIKLSSSKTTGLFCFGVGKEKLDFVWPAQGYISFLDQFTQYQGQKGPLYFYCGPWFKGQQFTKPGKRYVVFGQSWCDMCVLGTQVFGEALMQSSEFSIIAIFKASVYFDV